MVAKKYYLMVEANKLYRVIEVRPELGWHDESLEYTIQLKCPCQRGSRQPSVEEITLSQNITVVRGNDQAIFNAIVKCDKEGCNSEETTVKILEILAGKDQTLSFSEKCFKVLKLEIVGDLVLQWDVTFEFEWIASCSEGTRSENFGKPFTLDQGTHDFSSSQDEWEDEDEFDYDPDKTTFKKPVPKLEIIGYMEEVWDESESDEDRVAE